jgi:hypothetical protein
MATKKVTRLKYATWNVRSLGHEEEGLDKTLHTNYFSSYNNRNQKEIERNQIYIKKNILSLTVESRET